MNEFGYQEFYQEKPSISFKLTQKQADKLQKLLPVGVTLRNPRNNNRIRKIRPITDPYDIKPVPVKMEKQKRNAFAEAERTIKGTSKLYKRIENILMRIERDDSVRAILDGSLKSVDPAPISIKQLWSNLKEHKYEEMADFENDISRIWDHYMSISPEKSLLHTKASAFKQLYYNMLQKKSTVVKPVQKQVTEPKYHEEQMNGFILQKKLQQEKLNMKEMEEEEKDNLIRMIRKLPQEYLWGVWDIVAEESTQEHGEELEFDIEKLSIKVVRELEKYVRDSLNKMKVKKRHGVAKKNSFDIPRETRFAFNPNMG